MQYEIELLKSKIKDLEQKLTPFSQGSSIYLKQRALNEEGPTEKQSTASFQSRDNYASERQHVSYIEQQ